MIAALPPPRPVCRMCGYECGLGLTGCSYDEWPGRGKWPPPFKPEPGNIQAHNFVPPPAIEMVDDPPPALPRSQSRPQNKAPSTDFVGGGAMRRRWR